MIILHIFYTFSFEVEDREIEEILQLSTDHINTSGGSSTRKSTPKAKPPSKYPGDVNRRFRLSN